MSNKSKSNNEIVVKDYFTWLEELKVGDLVIINTSITTQIVNGVTKTRLSTEDGNIYSKETGCVVSSDKNLCLKLVQPTKELLDDLIQKKEKYETEKNLKEARTAIENRLWNLTGRSSNCMSDRFKDNDVFLDYCITLEDFYKKWNIPSYR